MKSRWFHGAPAYRFEGLPLVLQSAYKLSEDFAKPYFHKY